MKFLRIVCVFLIIAVLSVFLFACGQTGEENTDSTNNQDAQYKSANLLYCSNDTFNPYTLITKVNMELCQLLFDPLYKLNNNFEPIAVLSDGATQSGKTWTVTVKDVQFTDSSPLTGEDVVYSFLIAKECDIYSSQLKHVESATASANTVTFTLSHFDPYFLNVLDFPIIKKGSDNIKTEDDVILPPIGTGRYILKAEEEKIIRNEKYHRNLPEYSQFNLINAPDSESVAHYVEVGATDFYYANINDGTIIRMDGKKIELNTNRLVYIGVNMHNSLLKNVNFRYALSAAIDRNSIVNGAYYGNALPATGPITPVLSGIQSHQTIETSSNEKIAIENLEKIGYNVLDNNGFRLNSSGNELSLSLLVNSDNPSQMLLADYIASNLKKVGIKINISAQPYEQYLSSLKNEYFQLYIAEIKINNNFDLSELVLEGGSCAYGIVYPKTQNSDLSENGVTENENSENNSNITATNNIGDVISYYRLGKVSFNDVVSAISSSMPFIPICYRNGILFYSNSVTEIKNASVSDLFLSLDN